MIDGLAFAPKSGYGSGLFQRGARRFLALAGAHPERLIIIDNELPLARRFDAVLRYLRAWDREAGLLEFCAFCCHGWSSGIQLGVRVANVGELASELTRIAVAEITVPLYACSTGADDRAGAPADGDGSLADRLRDALCVAGLAHARVDAHTTVGHAFQNPYVRRFEGAGSLVGGQGGQWIVRPRAPQWASWRAALRGDLAFRFPRMTIAEIHAELAP